jgi:glucuronosyltransferase
LDHFLIKNFPGHDVTVLSHFLQSKKPQNYHEIILDQKQVITDNFPVEEVYTPRTYWNYYQEFLALADEGKMECEALLSAKNLDKVFELSREKPFDILVTEYFNTECALGVAYKANISSYIGMSSCALMPWHYDRIGLPDTPSYIPSEFVGFSDKMTLFERFTSFIVTKGVKMLYRTVEIEDNRLLKERFGDGIPDVAELVKQTELILVNQHFTFSGPRPMPPNVVEIGGIHIEKERKPLPNVSFGFHSFYFLISLTDLWVF